ncbi:SsgA family sporulation/cell division regulator [Amycolatopsis mongoliensis]|uniref:SsgA family sporulation/cell division regulator n=1 Tax=Amycolatopsis mongoliensis TaxID=715475 RepID=A0A9Y2NA26_9PSEU|nr:SsgA family sporulation/cell division regulator [Amycolatopsis sp. 4-36]WIX98170.1 SsgA family sporulation/cell division regulator [Amycolatopsis sp. 4-36]
MNDDAHFHARKDPPSEAAAYRHFAVFRHRLPNGRHVPIEVALHYDSGDPFAVKAVFEVGAPHEIAWLFSRELLADGLFTPAGEGDVRVRPCPGDPVFVLIELSSPAGRATFTADTADLAGFLYCTYDVVPPGEELSRVDFDLELSRLIPG